MSESPDPTIADAQNIRPLRGGEINAAFSRFMPMFYAHINPIFNRYRSALYDLNENQIKVVMAVRHLGCASPAELNHTLHIFKGSLTTIIRSLIEAGLLIRSDDPLDARKYYLTVTAKANALIREKTIRDVQRLDELFLDMPDSDLRKVCEGLSTLSAYLEHTEVK